MLAVLKEDVHIDMNSTKFVKTTVLFQWLVAGEDHLAYTLVEMCDINSPNCILGKVERVNVEDGTFTLTPEEDVYLSRLVNGDVMSDGSDEEGEEHDEEGQDVNENHLTRLQGLSSSGRQTTRFQLLTRSRRL